MKRTTTILAFIVMMIAFIATSGCDGLPETYVGLADDMEFDIERNVMIYKDSLAFDNVEQFSLLFCAKLIDDTPCFDAWNRAFDVSTARYRFAKHRDYYIQKYSRDSTGSLIIY